MKYYVVKILDDGVIISDSYRNEDKFELDELKLLRGVFIDGVTYTKRGTPKIKLYSDFYFGDLALVSYSMDAFRVRNRQLNKDKVLSLNALGRLIDTGIKIAGVYRDVDGILVTNAYEFNEVSKLSAKALLSGIDINVSDSGALNKLIISNNNPICLGDYCISVLAHSIKRDYHIDEYTLIIDSRIKKVHRSWEFYAGSSWLNLVIKEGASDDVIRSFANRNATTFRIEGSDFFKSYCKFLLYCYNLSIFEDYPSKEVDDLFLSRHKSRMLASITKSDFRFKMNPSEVDKKVSDFINSGLKYNHTMPTVYGCNFNKIPAAAFYMSARGRDLDIWKACFDKICLRFDKYEEKLKKILTEG